jgi:hypothetical protein
MTDPFPSQLRLARLIDLGAILTPCADGTVRVESDFCGLFYVRGKEVDAAQAIRNAPRRPDVWRTGRSEAPRQPVEGQGASDALRAMLAAASERRVG